MDLDKLINIGVNTGKTWQERMDKYQCIKCGTDLNKALESADENTVCECSAMSTCPNCISAHKTVKNTSKPKTTITAEILALTLHRLLELEATSRHNENINLKQTYQDVCNIMVNTSRELAELNKETNLLDRIVEVKAKTFAEAIELAKTKRMSEKAKRKLDALLSDTAKNTHAHGIETGLIYILRDEENENGDTEISAVAPNLASLLIGAVALYYHIDIDKIMPKVARILGADSRIISKHTTDDDDDDNDSDYDD